MDTPAPLPCVLIVDDEVNILSALQRLLRREPFDDVVSPSPVAALDLVREKKPALIIADNNYLKAESEYINAMMQVMNSRLQLEKLYGNIHQ